MSRGILPSIQNAFNYYSDRLLDNLGKFILYLLLSAGVVFCHLRFWMRPIQASEDRDSVFVGECRREIQSLTGTSIEYPSLLQAWKYFEVGFSSVILLGLAIILAV